jgi:hypothetical protein
LPSGERRAAAGNERYDRDANVTVPDAERLAVLSTWRADAEAVAAHDGFVRARAHLDRTVAECSELDDAVHAHFQVLAWTVRRRGRFSVARFLPDRERIDQ